MHSYLAEHMLAYYYAATLRDTHASHSELYNVDDKLLRIFVDETSRNFSLRYVM